MVAKLPVQQGGRIKPLYTWANYALLRMNRRSSVQDARGTEARPRRVDARRDVPSRRGADLPLLPGRDATRS